MRTGMQIQWPERSTSSSSFRRMIKNKLKEIKLSHVIVFLLVVLVMIFAGFLVWEANSSVDIAAEEHDFTMTIPIIGTEIDFREMWLIVASITIGLLDGFNPCAMWVLIYLITLVAQMKDKRKMWFIVGTFLLASWILYFIILSLWMNGWEQLEKLSFAQWITYFIWWFALFTGILAVKSFIESGWQVVCKVGDAEGRKKTMTRIQDLVHSPLTIASFFGIIVLAFVINSIEFACSVGLPAIYTQVLTIAEVSAPIKYLNIGVYTLAFMFDDLMIFILALMAINSSIMNKYSGLSKLLGWIIMIAIWVTLLFFPDLLV